MPDDLDLDLTDLLPGWDADDHPGTEDTGCEVDPAAFTSLSAFAIPTDDDQAQGFIAAEYGPAAMYAIYPVVDRVIPSMEVSGIVGDTRHGSGYHRSRNGLRRAGKDGDYSIQLPADEDGDGNACAAIDLKFSPADMRRVTKRLMVAFQRNDPRIECCREFFGTLNGRTVTGWNRAVTGRPIGYVTADATHLWHIHVSVFRRYATNRALMRGLADVIAGVPLTTSTPPTQKDDDMPTPKDLAQADVFRPPAYALEADPRNTHWKLESYLAEIAQELHALRAEVADLKSGKSA